MRFYARAQRRKDPNSMNGTERRYADQLNALWLAGEIIGYAYQPDKLRLADNTFYTPDFRVIAKDGTVEFHEVKGGFIRDDAIVKLKVAAEIHPYKFVLAQEKNRVWEFTEI